MHEAGGAWRLARERVDHPLAGTAGRVGGSGCRHHYNPRFLTGLPGNVTVRQADVREEGAFEERDFDLVHCRLLLMYMPDKVETLRRMAATLRPGGIVFAEEPDFNLATWFGWPDAKAQLANNRRIRAAQETSGQGSPFRDFPELLLEAGLEPIDIKYSASQAYGPADPMFQFYRLSSLPRALDRQLGLDDDDLAVSSASTTTGRPLRPRHPDLGVGMPSLVRQRRSRLST